MLYKEKQGSLAGSVMNCLSFARSHKSAEWLRSVGIWRYELVAKRHAVFTVSMEVARRRLYLKGRK